MALMGGFNEAGADGTAAASASACALGTITGSESSLATSSARIGDGTAILVGSDDTDSDNAATPSSAVSTGTRISPS